MEERQMLSLLAMGDFVVGGQKVAMMPMRARWKAADIFAWVGDELRLLEESAVLKKASLGNDMEKKPWNAQHHFPRRPYPERWLGSEEGAR